MRWTEARRRPLLTSVLAAGVAAVVALGTAGPASASAPAAPTAAPASVTLAGSLQSELGCTGDWQPDCTATHLVRVGTTDTWTKDFSVPAGSYELKVAIGDAWTENYGAGGVKDGPNIPLVLAGTAKLRFSYDATTHVLSFAPLDLPGPAVTAADRALAGRSLRNDLTRERFYFVMTDRFENGTAANDTGGLTGDRLTTGYDPTDKGFYHGGDLKGLTARLDYIQKLGTSAIWLTPSFKNRPVQGSGENVSAGYHGYWITDFTQIDPHLGTNAELKNLTRQAHKRGMKVFFDIITNHTADVIDYKEGKYGYVPKKDAPYKDASGTVFDDRSFAGKSTFPALDPEVSFPYTPVFRTEADRTVKVPAWLNNPIYYHNRGDSTFAGESSTYGDFVGLDDLFTEHPDVVKGMEDIYKAWVDFGIDGFRIDTAKHVNTEFWQSFMPAIKAEADRIGNRDFFSFGEVYDADPRFTSFYTTKADFQATLDFAFQARGTEFAQGKATSGLRDLFQADDWYTDADGNAYSLPTFLGNHDMGRIGKFLADSGAKGDELLRRDRLAHALMYLTRGQPVVYYGDEQGFVGKGGDKDARQDMFPSKVASYNEDPLIGTTRTTADSNFDTEHPLYRWISSLAALRAAHPGLADGTQVHRYASGKPGIYAFSRVDRRTNVEYVVALNNSTTAASASFPTFSRYAAYRGILGTNRTLVSDGEGRVRVSVPPLTAVVYKAARPVARRATAPAMYWLSPTPGSTISPQPASSPAAGRAELRVAVPDAALADVTYAWRVAGARAWTKLGTDDNAPYRVMPDVSALAKGTLVEIRAVLRDSSGNYSATSTYGVVGDPAAGGGGGGTIDPVVQPTAMSVPGDHNSEMGCPGDWQPDCQQAQLTRDPKDDVWKGTFTLPAGQYAYKAAIDKAWTENYGAGGVKDGANIGYTAPATPVTFYYDHATHWVTNTTQGPIVTAAGSFQAKLGCPGDWQPDCMRSWLQDPDGDGVYTFRTDKLPAGSYET